MKEDIQFLPFIGDERNLSHGVSVRVKKDTSSVRIPEICPGLKDRQGNRLVDPSEEGML